MQSQLLEEYNLSEDVQQGLLPYTSKNTKIQKIPSMVGKHCLINDGKFHEWLGKDFIRLHLHIIITVMRNKVTIVKYSRS